MGIVIVEGPDGSGKTTLLRNLRNQTTHYFWVMSSSGRPKTIEQLQDAVGYVGQAAYIKTTIICDRFPLISEMVYGPILRGYSLLDHLSSPNTALFSELLSSEIDRVIYCRPPIEQIKTNISNNPQLEGVRVLIDKLIKRYDELMNDLRDANVKVYNYDYVGAPRFPLDEIFFGKLHG